MGNLENKERRKKRSNYRGSDYYWVRLGDTPAVIAGTPNVIVGTPTVIAGTPVISVLLVVRFSIQILFPAVYSGENSFSLPCL